MNKHIAGFAVATTVGLIGGWYAPTIPLQQLRECVAVDLPPQMSLTFEEWERLDAALAGKPTTTTPDLVTRASAILRAAVREKGPINLNKGGKQ